jgi:hypothetical protein
MHVIWNPPQPTDESFFTPREIKRLWRNYWIIIWLRNIAIILALLLFTR